MRNVSIVVVVVIDVSFFCPSKLMRESIEGPRVFAPVCPACEVGHHHYVHSLMKRGRNSKFLENA